MNVKSVHYGLHFFQICDKINF